MNHLFDKLGPFFNLAARVLMSCIFIVAGWDKLGMMPSQIAVTPLAGGKLYFVAAEVALPQLGGKKGLAAPLALAAIVRPDRKGYTWTSLSFTTRLAR